MADGRQLYKAGLAAEKEGKFKIALKAYRAAARTDQDFRPAFMKLGELYSRARRPDLALVFFGRGLRLKRDAAVLFNMGSESYRLGQTKNSIRYLKAALQEDRHLLKAHLLLAFLYRKEGLQEKACLYFQNVRKLDPANRMAALGQAIALSELEHHAEARRILVDWLSKTGQKDSAVQDLLAGLELSLGNTEASYKQFRELSQSSPKFTNFTEHLRKARDLEKEEFRKCFRDLDDRISDRVEKLKKRMEQRKAFLKKRRKLDLSAAKNGIEGAQDLQGELQQDLRDMVDISLMHLFNGDSEKALKFLFQAHKMGKGKQ